MPALKFNEGIRKAILIAIERGNSQKNAAALVGLREQTLSRWLKQGREAKSGAYHDFVDAVAEAKVRGQQALIEHIRDTATAGLSHEETREEVSDNGNKTTVITKRVVDWRAAAWLLERRDPQHWGAAAKVEDDDGHSDTGPDANQGLRALRARQYIADDAEDSEEGSVHHENGSGNGTGP